ncbi:MAG: prepilin-type N-terminal cleavage/methylation domain-containing protein [Pirellulales bacterium]
MLHRKAFTLVELVAALAMAAVLMAAISGVLIYSHRQLGSVTQQSASNWKQSVERVFRNDVQLASEIYVEDNWVWLVGEFPVPGSDSYADRVGYGVDLWIPEANSNPTDQKTTPTALIRVCGTSGQPMLVGVNRFVIERLDDSGTPQPISASPTPIARQLRLWIWQQSTSEKSTPAGLTQEPTMITDLVAH